VTSFNNMAGDKVLVLGGTGPAGICLLRELVHRKHPIVVYARTPSKIPQDVASDPLVEIIQGDMTQRGPLSTAISKCRIILSLLGPIGTHQPKNTEYADYYRTIVELMKEHGVRRLFAMGTIAIYQPDDRFALTRFLMTWVVRIVAQGAYQNIMAIQNFFEQDQAARDIDWTVYRLGYLPGSSDAGAWLADREKGEAYVGPVGAPGWTATFNRSLLARWLVDAAESGAPDWIRRLPAVSQLAGSKTKSS